MVSRAVARLEEETRQLRGDVDGDAASFLEANTVEQYRRYLTRVYGFVAPLERSLMDTAGLDRHLEPRRLGKHLLIRQDLQALGLRPLELESLPQCMWIPWFDDVRVALGWAYIIERNTLANPNLFRHVASVLPGEAAFAASYLKCYSGRIGEMWQSFTDVLDASVKEPSEFEVVIAAAKSGYRFYRRWRNTVDGKANSDTQQAALDERDGKANPEPQQAARDESDGSSRLVEPPDDLTPNADDN